MYIAFSVSAYSRGEQTLGMLGRWCVLQWEPSKCLHNCMLLVHMYICTCAGAQMFMLVFSIGMDRVP